MQLDLNSEQELLRDTTARFIDSELPLSATRGLQDVPGGYDRSWLRKAAEIGWFAMLIPPAFGGGSVSGRGILDAAIVAEELGRSVQPGPFIAMNVAADAIARVGSDRQREELLPGIGAGQTVITWACVDRSGRWDAGAGLRLEPAGDGFVLRGARGFVADAVTADWLLVVAASEEGAAQVLVHRDSPGLHLQPLSGLDLSRRFSHVDFDGVVVPGECKLGPSGTEQLESQLRLAVALTCADTVGALEAMFAMTVAYAKDRVAFGRPIGSFQALKHTLADHALYLESCKAAAFAAARAVQDSDDAASEITSMAAAYIGDVGNDIGQTCLQVHGGIGYTWEHDLHLLLRRVRSNTLLYGEPSWHRERVCAFHRLGEA
jgi:alkylation response protein AidB-like acyl-CoA dehydrogenase